MRRTAIAAISTALFLSVVTAAHAQIIAGSPEDKAYTAIQKEANMEAKAAMIADFEKQFPQSKALPALYDTLLAAFRFKESPAKLIELAEKTLKVAEDDILALMVLSENYGKERRDVEKAVKYAQRAIDVIAKIRMQPTPIRTREADWTEWLNSNDAHAQALLKWAQSL